MSIDQAADHMHALGWSAGCIWFLDREHGFVWFVLAHKGEQVIRCRAEGAAKAWTAAVEMAEGVG